MSPDTTGTSLVRPMVHADLDSVLKWRNQPDVRRHMYTQHEISLDEHQRWFDRASQDLRKHPLIFEINTQPLGYVSFDETATVGIADWGFYLAPESPKGVGKQLGRVALDHAFTQLNFHKVCGRVLEYNERSIYFHRLLGFQQEGTLRDQHFSGERYCHVICFGMLCHEWQPNRTSQEREPC